MNQQASTPSTNLALPGYQIIEKIYESATSLVYRAVWEPEKRPVILKILKSDFSKPEELTRYKQEYEITRRLDTPGVIKAYGLEPCGNTIMLVLEDSGALALNLWLAEWTSGGTAVLPIPQFLRLATQMTEALAQIHAAGVIHMDVNPSNIVYNQRTGELKLIDFGLATTLRRETPTLAGTQLLEGTPAYLSPEQTGRMNRTVDYRTDLYSLGVTFYELLTGRLPFEAHDTMEFVHYHLAKAPVPPCQANPAVPPVLSDLVLKLLAKMPEDRYQSASGLKHDLDMCWQHWQTEGQIPDFALGQQDKADRFLIPEKLYGRASEVETLLSAFERVARGHTELLLVTGLSGIGKTAVINEVHKPIVRQRGYFIRGKFDQFGRNVPFSALVQAFRDLMGQIMNGTAAQQQQWRSQILSALGENGQVIIDVIPELARIIGPQPPLPELSGSAAQFRFNSLFQKFITTFTTREHPLVIFLDDLQWADLASLKLIELLTTGTETGYLLFLGAYRDNEVSPAHPLMATFGEIKKAGAVLNTITLTALQQSDINQLIADTLGCSPELALPLTKLVYQKTQGNPFFNNQFLRTLHEEGLVTFDAETGHWQCDMTRINALTLTDDVVEFTAQRLQKLPQATQDVLKLAACIGNLFDLKTLALVHQQIPMKTGSVLWKALQEGLVLPQSEIYKFYQAGGYSPDAPTLKRVSSETPTYRFLHDRVQQAAYSLIPESQKQAIHLSIGQLLLKNIPQADREAKIFDIVNQLNRGMTLLTEPAARHELAELNLIAGRKARSATAFRAALDYFTVGRQLLPDDCWQSSYVFTLHLYESLAEAAFLSGDFVQMEQLVATVLKEAHTVLDTIKVYEVKIQAMIIQNQLVEAINTGLQVLESLGVVFPKNPGMNEMIAALQETGAASQAKGIAALRDLPLMTDPTQLAAMRMLTSILPAAYISSIVLYTLLTLKEVDLSIQYGNTPISTHSYACYGLILCGPLGDYETGYQFGQLALDLVQPLNAQEVNCKVQSMVHAFIKPWKDPIRSMLIPLRSAYYNGLEIGDLQFAGYSAILYAAFAYFAGIEKDLSELQREASVLSKAVKQLNQITAFQYFQMLEQALHDLREGRVSSKLLKGAYYDEETMQPQHLQANDRMGLFYLYCHKLLLNYLLGDYPQAVEDATQTEQVLDGGTGLPYVPIFYFYDSLARIAAYTQTSDGDREVLLAQREVLLARIDANQEKLKNWAHFAPANYNHHVELVAAERARLLGERWQAAEAYDRAIAGARENGFMREEALANELAARFYLDWGKEKVAQAYMQEAYDGYARWGASTKVAQLESQYPWVLRPVLGSPQRAAGRSTVRTSVSISLDLLTVIKASQAIAGEIELSRLLQQLMRIAIENVGAQRGALLLQRGEEWVIEAQADVDNPKIPVLQAQRLEDSDALSVEIVSHVAHTQSSIVLNDAASAGDFTRDPYILRHEVKSVICIPLTNQARLSGILYLENNLTTRAFTEERLELLKVLSTQMALSLDHAQLYSNLEAKVAERTHSLAEAKEAAESANRLKGLFLANMSHELRTPLNAILNFTRFVSSGMLGPINEEQVDALNKTVDSGKHLLSLINDVLDITKIESQMLKLFVEIDVDLNEELQAVADTAEVLLEGRGIWLIKEITPDLPFIIGDRRRIRQILLNLVSNACKFTEHGSITIHAHLEGDFAVMFVRDTGPGIPLEDQTLIFESFRQSKAGLKHSGGTGLGLAIAKRLAEAHGGRVWLDSILGVGSTFYLSLPVHSDVLEAQAIPTKEH